MDHTEGTAARRRALTVAEAADLLGIDAYFVMQVVGRGLIRVVGSEPLMLDPDSVGEYGAFMRRRNAAMDELRRSLEDEDEAFERACGGAV